MKARHFSLLATLFAMALTQACSDNGSGAAGSAVEPETTTQTVSNATPEAQAAGLRTQQADLQRERELVSARAPEPEPPVWRSPRDRQGAPSWRARRRAIRRLPCLA